MYTAFLMPLLDYCDIVWYPTTAKLTSMTESVISKFVKKMSSSITSILSFTLTECQ